MRSLFSLNNPKKGEGGLKWTKKEGSAEKGNIFSLGMKG